MDIVHSDFKKGIVKLRVNDLDDLWYLHQIIEQGDLVTGKTTRKMKIGDSENAKSVKITMVLTIEAETIDFSESGTSLRINGKVKEGPEDVPKDSYHVVSLEEGTDFTLQKKSWLTHQKKRLQEAAEKKYQYLLCVFDREEAILAMTQKAGYNILLRLQGEVQKKERIVEIKKDFQEEIIKLLQEYNLRYKPEKIILSSPAFYKEDVYKKITSPELKSKIVLAICSDVSEAALDEVIKRPELASILKTSRSRQEKMLVDELLTEINKEQLAVYGWKEVDKAIFAGAVQKLLLTDKFIKQQRLAGKFEPLDQAMKTVDSQNAEVHIISSENESGKKLDGLGGIAAILRYKMWE